MENTIWTWFLFSEGCIANIDKSFWGIVLKRLFVKESWNRPFEAFKKEWNFSKLSTKDQNRHSAQAFNDQRWRGRSVNIYITEFLIFPKKAFNGRRIYPFNKGLRIYGGGVPPPFWHVTNWYFYWWCKVETLQIVTLAFLV